MDLFEEDVSSPGTWKKYLLAAIKFLIIFYIASFCMGVLFLNRGEQGLIPGIIAGLLYVFIIIASAIQMVKKLPVSAIMLAAPTIPLLMMIIIVSLLPVLQFLDKRPPLLNEQPKVRLH